MFEPCTRDGTVAPSLACAQAGGAQLDACATQMLLPEWTMVYLFAVPCRVSCALCAMSRGAPSDPSVDPRTCL